MSDFSDAEYIVEEVISGINEMNMSGIPPRSPKIFYISSDFSGRPVITVQKNDNTTITLEDKTVETICYSKGVVIVKKVGDPPKNQYDGKIILDTTSAVSVSYTDTDKIDNYTTTYYAAFAYSDHNVYNLRKENIKKWPVDVLNTASALSYRSDAEGINTSQWFSEYMTKKPEEFEKLNDSSYMYRKNIQQLENGQWECESRIIGNDTYNEYMRELNSPAQNELMKGQKLSDENALIIMEAIADLYSMMCAETDSK